MPNCANWRSRLRAQPSFAALYNGFAIPSENGHRGQRNFLFDIVPAEMIDRPADLAWHQQPINSSRCDRNDSQAGGGYGPQGRGSAIG
jgi:hypothetical protein